LSTRRRKTPSKSKPTLVLVITACHHNLADWWMGHCCAPLIKRETRPYKWLVLFGDGSSRVFTCLQQVPETDELTEVHVVDDAEEPAMRPPQPKAKRSKTAVASRAKSQAPSRTSTASQSSRRKASARKQATLDFSQTSRPKRQSKAKVRPPSLLESLALNLQSSSSLTPSQASQARRTLKA
jgi:hypothetical protein